MAQAINLGGGLGPAIVSGLGGYKAGREFSEARAKEKRAAAIDTENLRGAGIRNDNSKAEGEEDRAKFEGELTEQRLRNTGLEQNNEIQGYNVLDAARNETTEQALDPQRSAIALKEQAAKGATADNTSATQTRSAAEQGLLANRDKAAAGSRDSEAVFKARADAAKAKSDALESEDTAKLYQTYGSDEAVQAAEVESLADEFTNMFGMQFVDPTGATLANYLNTSKQYKITGAKNAKIDDKGILRVYDADGNPSLDFGSDADGDGEPDEVAFDTNHLTDDMLRKFAPEYADNMIKARAAQAAKEKAALTSSGRAKDIDYAKELSRQIDTAQNDYYNRSTVVGGETTTKPKTPSMVEEHGIVLANAERYVANGMREGAAYAKAMKHPVLTATASDASGLSPAGVEIFVKQQRKKYADDEDVFTRYQILNALINRQEAQAQ